MRQQIIGLLLLLFVSNGYSQPTDYIGYWPLSGDAYDMSSNSLDGTISGAYTEPGHNLEELYNSSLYFDGISDYVEIPYSSLLQFGTGSFSVSLWIKPEINGTMRLIDSRGTGTAGSYPGFQIVLESDASGWYFNTTGTDDSYANYFFCMGNGNTYTCDQWHHISMVFQENSELRLYVDGELDATIYASSYGGVSNSLPLVFGAALVSSGYYNPPSTMTENFKGNLEDIYLFDRLLSETEISWLAEKLTIDFSYDNAGNRLSKSINLNTAGGTKSARAIEQPVMDDSVHIAQIKLFPNPTAGEIHLQIIQEEEIERASVNVYNTSGSIIFSRRMYEMQETINLSGQIPGLYLVVVNVNDKQHVWRVIKE